jgi:glutaredoxin
MAKKYIIIGAAIIIPLIFILAILFFNRDGGIEKEALAKCLTEKGYAMAGTSWCPHCKEQKELFGDAFQYVTYHDCDEEADWCTEHNVEGYPSWISPQASVSPGVKPLRTLKNMADC